MRMKRFITMSLALIITFSSFAGCDKVSENDDDNNLIDNLIGGNTIVKTYEAYYEQVKEGFLNYDEKIVVDVSKYDKDIYTDEIINIIASDNPEILGLYKNYTQTVQDFTLYTRITFEVEYDKNKDELVRRETAVNNKITEIISEIITKDMTDFEKEKAIHDYIINNCRYDERYFSGDMPNESYTAYGTLINKLAVCQGYAIAAYLLLDAVGIENTLITGDAYNETTGEYISHAWNLVNLDGEYYHLDLTWDDPIVSGGGDVLSYSYFNLSDEQIKATHRWNEDNFSKCTSTEYNFDNLGFVEKDHYGNDIKLIKSYDEFYTNIEQDVRERKATSSYKFTSIEGKIEEINNWVHKAYVDLNVGGQYNLEYSFDKISKAMYVIINLTYQ